MFLSRSAALNVIRCIYISAHYTASLTGRLVELPQSWPFFNTLCCQDTS